MKWIGTLLITTATLGVAMPSAAQTAPQPNPKFWLGPDDYPSDVFRDGGQGAVGMRLSVDPNGKVYRCEVFASSGWPNLDKATCMASIARARFSPARDSEGQAIYGSFSIIQFWINPNSWAVKPTNMARWEKVFRDERLPPAATALVDVKFFAETDGRISNCSANDDAAPAVLADLACHALAAAEISPLVDQEGIKTRSVMTVKAALTNGEVPASAPKGEIYFRNK